MPSISAVAVCQLTQYSSQGIVFNANGFNFNGNQSQLSIFLDANGEVNFIIQAIELELELKVEAEVNIENGTMTNYYVDGISYSGVTQVFEKMQEAISAGKKIVLEVTENGKYNSSLGILLEPCIIYDQLIYFQQHIPGNNLSIELLMIIFQSNSYIVGSTSIAAMANLEEKIQTIQEIANGKCKAYVFQSKLKLELEIANYKNNQLGKDDVLYGAELKIGDVFLIIDTGVPDYWWNGNDISELETTKVDLTSYYDKTEIDEFLDNLVPANSSRASGYLFKESTSVPTVDDRSIITFVVEG